MSLPSRLLAALGFGARRRVREATGHPFATGAEAVLVPLGPWPVSLGPEPEGLAEALLWTRAAALRPGQATATDGLGTGVAHLIHVAPPTPGSRAGSYAAGIYLAGAVGARTLCIPLLWPDLPDDDAARRSAASLPRGGPDIVLAAHP